jgi:ABC-2 type transport system ATP-binding protein
MELKFSTEPLVVRVHGLCKRYGSKTALRFVNLEVKKGEMVGVLGVNGAGKSTLLNILTGLIPASEGYVQVLGYPPGTKASKRALGFLPEFFFALENLTIEGYLRMVSELHGMSRAVYLEQLERLAEAMEIGEILHTPMGTLSKGLLRRVGIVRSLLHRPELILMDEPGWSLDPLGRRALQLLLQSEKARGASIIVSSHVLDIVENLCDRFVILHGGKLVADVPRSYLDASVGYEIVFSGLEETAGFFAERNITVTRMNGKATATVPEPVKDEVIRQIVNAGGSVEHVERRRKDLVALLEDLKGASILE